MPHQPRSQAPTASTEHPADRVRWSRRTFLAATGAVSFGTLTTIGAAQSQTAPETYEGFQTAVAETLDAADPIIDGGPYDPDWESLDAVDPIPEWYRDAKFGIFFHWGPYAVLAFGHEWYPRQMYNVGNWINEYHTETYGDPADAPYQEFVPEFTAENFDAEEWASLFERAGARYAGPVIEHHDGFSLWDSDVTPWNAGDRGPETDLAGALESAIRDEDLRFVTTFHHSYNLVGADGYFSTVYENYPSVTEGYPDRIMYGNLPEDLQMDTWLAKLVEVLQGYGPDFVWFDWGLPDIPDRSAIIFMDRVHTTSQIPRSATTPTLARSVFEATSHLRFSSLRKKRVLISLPSVMCVIGESMRSSRMLSRRRLLVLMRYT